MVAMELYHSKYIYQETTIMICHYIRISEIAKHFRFLLFSDVQLFFCDLFLFRPVAAYHMILQARVERHADVWMRLHSWPLTRQSIQPFAEFLHSDPEDLVYVNNATSGVNAVLYSIQLSPGDVIITPTLTYNACKVRKQLYILGMNLLVRLFRSVSLFSCCHWLLTHSSFCGFAISA